MHRLSAILLLAICGLAKSPPKKVPTTGSVTKALLQMERDWSQAGINRDSKTMERILADDWVSIDFHGKTVTKEQAIAELKSARSGAQPIELGEMKVKVFGSAAVVTGRDSNGEYAWIDVFVKRDGRWQAVASQSTKIEK